VALDGSGDRQKAGADTRRLSRSVAAQGVPCLVIDVSPRRSDDCASLARALGARHLPLPQANAVAISSAIGAALGD